MEEGQEPRDGKSQTRLAEERKETKKVIKYQNIDKDLNDYESTLYSFAVQHLTFDLDDGVKVNYQKFASVLKPIK